MPAELRHSLGKNLKGNRRHLDFFCGNLSIAGFRRGMIQLIEESLWTLLDNIRLGSGNISSFLKEINNTLLNLRDSHAGRLSINEICTKNYLTIDAWLDLFQLDSVEDSRKSNKFILLHIFGFGTALGDGELEVKHLGIVDCIHMGIIPTKLDNLVDKLIHQSCSNTIDANTKKCMENTLSKVWNDTKELAKGKFIGLHRIVGGISKEVEKTFRKKYDLNIRKLKNRREELKKLKKQCPPPPDNHLNQKGASCDTINQYNVTQLWARPSLCQGLTCGNSRNFWNVMENHNPYWIASGRSVCERCGRIGTALRKCLAFCRGAIQDESVPDDVLTLLNLKFPDSQSLSKSNWPRIFQRVVQKGGFGARRSKVVDGSVSINDKQAMLLTAKVFGMEGVIGGNWSRKLLIFDLLAHDLENLEEDTSFNTLKLSNISKPSSSCEHTEGFALPEGEILSERLIIFGATRGILLVQDLLMKHINKNEKISTVNTNGKDPKKSNLQRRFTSKITNGLGLHNVQGYTAEEAAQLIKIQGQPLSCIIMEIATMKLRNFTNRRTFISCANVADIIGTSTDSQDNWNRIANTFDANLAKERIDGLYFLPLFIGNHLKCNWSFMYIHKRRKKIKGWHFFFTGTTRSEALPQIRLNVEKLFGKEDQISWNLVNMNRNARAEDGIHTLFGGMMACWKFMDEDGPENWTSLLSLGSGKAREHKVEKIRNICSKLILNDKSCWNDLSALFSQAASSDSRSDLPKNPKRKYKGRISEKVRKIRRLQAEITKRTAR